MDDQNVAIRLKGFIYSMGLTYSQFADECGIPRPSLSQLLSGRNKKISDVLVGQIHKAYPELSVLWLLFGDGPMISESLQHSSASSTPGDDSAAPSNDFNGNSSRFGSNNENDNLKISGNLSDIENNENVRALNMGDSEGQMADNRLVEALSSIKDLQLQIEEFKKSARKVTQITVYYDDSTFETFVPFKNNN